MPECDGIWSGWLAETVCVSMAVNVEGGSEMKFSEDLTVSLLREFLAGVRFTDEGIFSMSYPTQSAVVLNALIVNGFIDRTELEGVVHSLIIDLGKREMFIDHLKNGIPPDELMSPRALGYAIDHGAFVDREVRKIRFNHGETAEDYRERSHGLLEKVVAQLLDPPAPTMFASCDASGFCEGCPAD